MADSFSIPGVTSWQIGGYAIQRELAPGRTYLATAPGGRTVVLKVLDADCLLRGQLHPMIKDRLGRVRELAHLGVANLLSVQRDGEHCFLVWEFIAGRPLDEYVNNTPPDALARRDLARQLVSSVETLHGLGLVHGALHCRNIIVTADGHIRLTHVSPLLYNDPRVDIECLLDLLEDMDCPCPWREHPPTLRQLMAFLARGGLPTAPTQEQTVEQPTIAKTHRWAIVAAIAVALAGAAASWLLWRNLTNPTTEQPVASLAEWKADRP